MQAVNQVNKKMRDLSLWLMFTLWIIAVTRAGKFFGTLVGENRFGISDSSPLSLANSLEVYGDYFNGLSSGLFEDKFEEHFLISPFRDQTYIKPAIKGELLREKNRIYEPSDLRDSNSSKRFSFVKKRRLRSLLRDGKVSARYAMAR